MITATLRCIACDRPMIDTGEGHNTHPACDVYDTNAATIRAQAAVRQIDARHAAGHTKGDTGEHAAALAVIHAVALRQPIVSANDLRTVDGWERLHGPVRGAAITTAIRRHWLEPIGLERSSSKATHGHRVGRYRSLIHHGSTT